MRKISIIASIVIAFFIGSVFAAPTAKYLIDSTPGENVLINLIIPRSLLRGESFRF